MNLEYAALGLAVLFFAACLWYASAAKRPSIAQLVAPLRPAGHPIQSAFESIETEAKRRACELLADEIGQSYVDQYRERLKGTLSPKATPPPAPGSSS